LAGVTTTFVAGAGAITSTGGTAFIASALPGLVCIGPVGWGIIVCAGVGVVTGGVGYGLYRLFKK